ncbi:MAG: major facilitator superfamily protein [Rhodobacteraceae bacterium]|nr:MAG: major facilitator superfamily protein [Paracoccaceae bacterium]
MDQARVGRWAVAAMFATNGFIMGAWAPQIPLLLPRHQISETTLGLLILVLGIGAVGAMLFAGRLIAAYGSRTVLRTFALATVPTLPLVVLSPSLWLVAPAMALMGGLIGCMDVSMNANAVEVERRLGRAIMSSSHGFWSLGGFVGGIAGSFVIAQWGAEVQAFGVAAIALLTVLLAAPRLIADAPHPAEAPPAPHAMFPRDAALWILGFMALFSMVPEGAVLDWAAIYLSKELGSGLFVSGLAFACFAGDRLRNRFGAVKTLQISGLVSAAGMMGGAVAPTDFIAIASFAFAGLGIANMVPIMFSAAGNHPGMAAGSAISTVTMVGYAGILVAPSSIGYIAEHIGFRFTYGALALLLLLVTALAGCTAAADGVKKV